MSNAAKRRQLIAPWLGLAQGTRALNAGEGLLGLGSAAPGAAVPGWVASIDDEELATMDADFVNSRAWSGGHRASITSLLASARALPAYYTNADGTLTQFALNTLRFGTNGEFSENASTNIILQSQTFDTATWTKTSGSITANAIAAPDGTLTADLFTEAAASSNHSLFSGNRDGSTNAQSSVASIYVKRNGRDCQISFNGTGFGSSQFANFDLTGAGALGTVTGGTATITALANGWYYITFTAVASATSSSGSGFSLNLINALDAVRAVSYLGDGTSGVYAWGAQIETNSSVATSYIPTTTVAVTRPADIVTFSDLNWFDGATFTGYIEHTAENVNNAVLWAFDATNDKTVDEQTGMSTRIAGATVANTAAAGTTVRTAFRMVANDFAISMNGGAVVADTSETAPGTLTASRLGVDLAGANSLNGYIRRVTAFKGYAATDGELINLSAGRWVPSSLGSSLLASLDASDLTTLFQDDAATTPVTANNDPVGCWNAAGAGSHAFTSTLTARPLYKTAGGLHWVENDGVNDILTSAARVIPTSPPFSICIAAGFTANTTPGSLIAQYTAAQAGRMSWNINQNSGGTTAAGSINPSINGVSAGRGISAATLSPTAPIPSTFVLEILAGAGAEQADLYLNGTLMDTFTVATVRDTVMELFANAATIGFAGVKRIYGLIVTNTKLSGADRIGATAHLKMLAGVTTAAQAPAITPVSQTLAMVSSQTVPDGLGGDTGKGFTCTGLDYDIALDCLWAGNDGRNSLGDPSYQPSLVRLSLDGATKLQEIDLAALFPGIGSVQGVAVDESDNTLWFASLNENLVRHVTKAGVSIGSFTLASANGIAYDAVRDCLWVSASSTLRKVSKAGDVLETYVLGISSVDMLHYDPVADRIWITTDESGPSGLVRDFDPNTGILGVYIYTLTGATAIEGVYVTPTTIKIMNDAYMHAVSPSLNQMLTYSR